MIAHAAGMQSRGLAVRESHHEVKEAWCELDTHADNCCVGDNFMTLEHTSYTVNVTPFHPEYQAIKNVPIVKAATAYVSPITGETVILVVNQALAVPNQPVTLLNPNQMRFNGLLVDDVPRFLHQSSTHSIYDSRSDFRIPLKLRGIHSGFISHTPSKQELEECRWIELTSEAYWDPCSDAFEKNESIISDREEGFFVLHDRDILTVSACHLTSAIQSQVQVVRSTPEGAIVKQEQLARLWKIPVRTAEQTLKVTTQKGIVHPLKPLQARYRTKQAQLRYNQLGGRHGRFYSDTMFSSVPSIQGNTCAQVFVNDVNFTRVYPMKKKRFACNALLEFIRDVGIPSTLHTDNAKELTYGGWKKITSEHQIPQTLAEPYSPWQVRAEGAIRELKRGVNRLMEGTNAPRLLWDFCAAYVADLRSMTVTDLYSLQGRTPWEIVTGHTPDISEYTTFAWYDPVWYYEPMASFPEERKLLARWLGVAHRVGQAMCYYLLLADGMVIARSTVQPILREDLSTNSVQERIRQFDITLLDTLAARQSSNLHLDLPRMEDEDLDHGTVEPMEPEAAMPEADEYMDPEILDNFISAQVLLQKGDEMVTGKVVARKRDADGVAKGRANANPILDTRVYQVEFADGSSAEYAANVIAEAIYAQVDAEGRHHLVLEDVIDYRKSTDACRAEDMWVTSKNGNKHRRLTTKGWDLCVQWKDGSTSWIPLKDLKESNPIEVAEFAIAHKIEHEPAFAWWVPHVIKTRERVISAMKSRSRYWARHQKFGIPLPKSPAEALQMDKENGNDLWARAMAKELSNVDIAFDWKEVGEKPPPGYQKIPYHFVFDIKMDFTRKARLVAGGHVTDVPSVMTYSSVVSRDSVRIMFMIAALNDLDIMAGDIGNAYLNAETTEKVYMIAGSEFGERAGRVIIIRRALYGLKSSGAAFHAHLANALQSIGFISSLADPDVWYRAAIKPNGEKYYEYLLTYVDDILLLSCDPNIAFKQLTEIYRFKEPPGKPKKYLGADVFEFYFPNDPTKKRRWGMSSEQYVKEAVRMVKVELAKIDRALPKRCTSPFTSGYRPELDFTSLLSHERANYYQQLIGILRWIVELGRIDIHVNVALLSKYLAQPREGHLEAVFRIFAYLDSHSRSKMVFDDTIPQWDESRFTKCDWGDLYKDSREAKPPNMPEPRGREVEITCFVDADHAGDKVTRKSQTGILTFINSAPIQWYSKRQNCVETSTFGSEFIAMKTAVEQIEALRYKLRMFGIPIAGPANVFCDNDSVVVNCTKPESTIKKKHNAIAYHKVREAVVIGIIRVAWEASSTNLADILTKPLAAPALQRLCAYIFH